MPWVFVMIRIILLWLISTCRTLINPRSSWQVFQNPNFVPTNALHNLWLLLVYKLFWQFVGVMKPRLHIISYHISRYPWTLEELDLTNVPYQQHSWPCIYLNLLVQNYEWWAKKNRKSLYFFRTDISRKFIWTSIWQQIPEIFNGETMY